jgi:hypothetical protein
VVRVLVGKVRGEQGRFTGFWAEFEGEKVASYEKDDVVYTLYRATWYEHDAYRVYISDETNPKSPAYELLPVSGDPFSEGVATAYAEPYRREAVVEKYPLFIKSTAEKDERDERIDNFRILPVDPQRRPY